MHRLWIPGPLPGLNEILEARILEGVRRARGKTGWTSGTYSEMKRKWGDMIRNLAEAYETPLYPEGAHLTYLIFEPNRRRDPSNVRCGAVKLIEDGLQEAGVLRNDGWKDVLDSREHLEVDPVAPGVAVFLRTDRVLEKHEAMEMENAQEKATTF